MQGKESEAEEERDRARKGERGKANSASQSEMGRRPSLNSETDSMIAWLDDCDRDAKNHANRR